MDTNPYQAPPISSELIPMASLAPANQTFVDGNTLMVTSGSVLPSVCIKTNQPVSEEDMVTKDYYWCPPWAILLVLLSPLLLLIAYFLVRKKCTLTFALHPSVRSQYRKRQVIKVIIAIGLLVATVFAAGADSGLMIGIFFIAFLIAVIATLLGNSPISIKKYRKGAFWVKGCSPEFLMDMQQ